MTDYPFPQSAKEMQILTDLVWGEHPELETVGDIRAELTKRLEAHRQEVADQIAAQNANGMRYEASRRGPDPAPYVAFDEATSLLDEQGRRG